jgi:hypothetical protein
MTRASLYEDIILPFIFGMAAGMLHKAFDRAATKPRTGNPYRSSDSPSSRRSDVATTNNIHAALSSVTQTLGL